MLKTLDEMIEKLNALKEIKGGNFMPQIEVCVFGEYDENCRRTAEYYFTNDITLNMENGMIELTAE